MKAAIYTQYGPPDVLKLSTLPRPEPKANELLVKIHATTVTSGDVRLRGSDFPPLFWLPARLIFGLFRPKKQILGHEFAGEVVGIGSEVTKFKIGDQVFGTTTMLKRGSYAEYVCVPESWKHGAISLKPKNLDYAAAAALPIGAMTAMFLLEKAQVKSQDKVLIYGASGSVGSYAIQLAKTAAATVTAVCSSKNFPMVKSLGADVQLDYHQKDYSSLSERYDIIFDAVGKTSKSIAKRVLKPGGKFVSVTMLTKEQANHLAEIRALAENGQLTAFIDRTYPLEQIVDAHRYVDSGRKRGNVIIDTTTPEQPQSLL